MCSKIYLLGHGKKIQAKYRLYSSYHLWAKLSNATMYREAGARRGVHFNPECPHSVRPTVRAWTRVSPRRTQVYAKN